MAGWERGEEKVPNAPIHAGGFVGKGVSPSFLPLGVDEVVHYCRPMPPASLAAGGDPLSLPPLSLASPFPPTRPLLLLLRCARMHPPHLLHLLASHDAPLASIRQPRHAPAAVTPIGPRLTALRVYEIELRAWTSGKTHTHTHTLSLASHTVLVEERRKPKRTDWGDAARPECACLRSPCNNPICLLPLHRQVPDTAGVCVPVRACLPCLLLTWASA